VSTYTWTTQIIANGELQFEDKLTSDQIEELRAKAIEFAKANEEE
jgi:uncharacterized protein involved in tolerance to divalent cations